MEEAKFNEKRTYRHLDFLLNVCECIELVIDFSTLTTVWKQVMAKYVLDACIAKNFPKGRKKSTRAKHVELIVMVENRLEVTKLKALLKKGSKSMDIIQGLHIIIGKFLWEVRDEAGNNND